MKFSLLQENLHKNLKIVKTAITNKSQLPILATVLLKVENSQLTLAATDLYLGIRAKITAEVEKEGEVAIPALPFFEVVNSLPAGKLNLELKGNSLIIKTRTTKASLQTLSSEDFPQFPEAEEKQLLFQVTDLQETLNKVAFAASRDETRPALTSILFNLGEKSQVVATDGFRLSILELKSSYEELSFKVPAKTLLDLNRVISLDEKEQIKLGLSAQLQQLFFSTGQIEVFIRLIDSQFPPFEKIIPSDFVFTAQLDRAEFEEVIKRACVFAKDSSYIVNLIFSEEELKINSVSSSIGNFEETMIIKKLKGEGGEISFNAQYLLDYLQNIKTETLIFQMNESLQPALLQPKANDNYKYIVMPFRVQQAE